MVDMVNGSNPLKPNPNLRLATFKNIAFTNKLRKFIF